MRKSSKDRIGEKHTTNEGYEVEIIKKIKTGRYLIVFLQNSFLKEAEYQNIKKGQVKNPYHPSVYGLGYTGVGEHKVSKNGKHTKVYTSWIAMLERAYSKSYHEKFPTYKNVEVDNNWYNFQTYGDWFKCNWKEEYMDSSWHLDKDILSLEFKIYSPKNCCFIPHVLNTIVNLKTTNENGITKTSQGKYTVSLNIKGVKKYFKTFDTKEEALYVYEKNKKQEMVRIADVYKEKIDIRVYNKVVNFKIYLK